MKKIIFGLSMALVAAGCGSSPVTQYVINVDQQQAISTGTNAQCHDADPQTSVTTTDLKEDLILSTYEESDGTVYAELSGHVYTGKKSGDSLSLTDSQSHEDTTSATTASRDFVRSDVYTLNIKKDGDYLSGSVTHEHHESCAGNGCGQAESQTIDCIYSTNLRGRKLPDSGTDANRSQPGNVG
jgi:hypothetical protein